MNILAIDSSGVVASVAVMSDDILVGEYTINNKQTHSQTLLPMLREVVERSGITLNEMDAIAIAKGPGSFTGLRIGSSTAKGLGLALNKPIVSVSSLQGLAYNLFGFGGVVCPLMDARRNQAYTGIYQCDEDGVRVIEDDQAVPIEEIIEKVNQYGFQVIFLGDGIPVFKEYIKENCKVDYSFAPAHLSRQKAGSVAALGAILFKKGIMESAESHKPVYLRLSQAERERLEKEKD